MELLPSSPPDAIDDVDMLKMQLHDKDLEIARLKLEMKRAEMQAALDALWIKYQMVKDVDRIALDGKIVRGKAD